jgi:hypothetical protein
MFRKHIKVITYRTHKEKDIKRNVQKHSATVTLLEKTDYIQSYTILLTILQHKRKTWHNTHPDSWQKTNEIPV